MGSRAICVSRDAGVRSAVEAALARAGVTVDHHEEPRGTADDVVAIVVDRATREASSDALRVAGAPVVVVGDDLDDDLIALMLEAPVSHLVGDPGDRELSITTAKLASGDLFGLEKYLAAGAAVRERVVHDEVEKRAAMDEVRAWAEFVGARSPVLHRLASVTDELLMNALVDAPREAGAGPASAVLRWAHDDRFLAISVGDPFGALRQRHVMDHVRRARGERGRPQPGTVEDPGAGIGLYLVLSNVASLIVNVDPGQRTEVVCLFELARGARRAVTSGVRSLHVFSAPAA